MQSANVGLLIYVISTFVIKKVKPNPVKSNYILEKAVIFVIIIVGASAMLALSFTWHVTSPIGR